MLDLVLERGYEALSVEAVLDAADVSGAEFGRHYAGVQDCYMKLFDQFTAEFDAAVFGGWHSDSLSWRERLRAAGYGAARYIRDNPRRSAFSSIAMFAAGDLAQARREEHLARLVDLIDAGRAELADPDSVSRAIAEGVLGSIYLVATKTMRESSELTSIEALVPEMMYLAVRPYLGHEAALAELSIPPPPEATWA